MILNLKDKLHSCALYPEQSKGVLQKCFHDKDPFLSPSLCLAFVYVAGWPVDTK